MNHQKPYHLTDEYGYSEYTPNKNICINVCIIKIHVPRAHEVKNQRVIAKRTSQIMKYGQDVIIQKRTDDNIQ